VRPVKDERGAVAVMVALLMVPLMGFAAIGIDVAAMHAERVQLQTGADAAAFAIAQNCSNGACGTTAQTAQDLSAANLNPHDTSTATVTALTHSSVTVRNSGVRQHLFAPVLGINSTTLTVEATVTWAGPKGGTAQLPLAFSWCEWQAQTGGGLPSGTVERTIVFPKKSDTGCTGPSGKVVPGGFGWLDADPGTCQTTSTIGQQVGSSSGNSVSNGCNPADFTTLRGATVLLPIFVSSGGTGGKAWYQVHGYAAFHLTGYYFAGQYNWNSPCGGSDRCIKGYFTRYGTLSGSFSTGPDTPQLGASVIRLTK
jgi:Flp pilus assembly protein TadG